MANTTDIRFYCGKSMRGIFKKSDCLHLEKPNDNIYRVGDIIVFKDTSTLDLKKELVHRIIKITVSGVITKGDNNNAADPDIIKIDNISGIVSGIERNGKFKRISGGVFGYLSMKLTRVLLLIKKVFIVFTKFPFNMIAGRLNLSSLWDPISIRGWFNLKNGLVLKYIRKGKVIARWYPGIDRFNCRIFYRPFIKKPDIGNTYIEALKNNSFLRFGFSNTEAKNNPINN